MRGVVVVCSFLVCSCAEPPPPPIERFGSDLHEHPAACGQEEYQWLDDDSLGSVLAREPVRIYEESDSEGFLETLREADAADVTHVPQRRVFLDRFRYVTQDRGSLVEATALLAYPDPKEVAGAIPLLLYTHGTSGYSDACAPSRLAESPAAVDAAIAAVFASVFQGAGEAGAVVVVPDYLGMNGFGAPSASPHPYFVAEATAIAALDAARAGLALAAEDGVDVEGLLVGGGSQGGHAAAVTVRWQPHYAADLPFLGVVEAIPPLDLLGQATRAVSPDGLAAPVNVGNILAVLISAQRWYGVDKAELFQVVDAAVVADVEAGMSSSCALNEVDLPLDQVFTPAALAAAEAGDFGSMPGPWGCIMARSSPLDTDVALLNDVPALVVTGSDDDLVDAVVERGTVERLCDSGATVVFQECAGRDHGGAFLASIDDMLSFLEGRARGDVVEGVCEIAPPGLCGSDPG